MGFKQHQFGSWNEFKKDVWQQLPGRHDYDIYKRFIFRGQADADWNLISSLDRAYVGKRPSKKDAIARELIQEFYEECARLSDWRCEAMHPRVLAMAQHHGLPTRLLDWSFSPYVAAYFAYSWFVFEGKPAKSERVAIWAINRNILQGKAPKNELEIIAIQDHENSRLGGQHGVFTFLKTEDAYLEAYLARRAARIPNVLAKFELPARDYRDAIQDLILMGIHHGTIFPDKDGIAKMIKLRTLLQA